MNFDVGSDRSHMESPHDTDSTPGETSIPDFDFNNSASEMQQQAEAVYGDAFIAMADTVNPSTSTDEIGRRRSKGATTHLPRDFSSDQTTKVLNRFTASAVKVLRDWIANHERHPYATPHDIEMLQSKTGLTRLQVTNWLANTRRRSKLQPSRSSSPLVRGSTEWEQTEPKPLDIPLRRLTPVPFEHMNILERWEVSPPEHEPAALSDINRAINASSETPHIPYYASDRSSDNASSVSSAALSHSSRGSSSRASVQSRNSLTSFGKSTGKRRRRRGPPRRQTSGLTSLISARHMYQCSFCIETFKHKYDWQRHEKSLHLSLEEWVCSPTGAIVISPETAIELCVYCGAADPDQSHLEEHNHTACQDRSVSERTYYRKDHLQQHLKLVHASKFMKWPMDQWKAANREVRSRCGFCGARLASWDARVEHLADHFKAGSTMADWKGDWGFDPLILETVENAMPPYLIHYEQISPLPISSTRGPADTPTSAYELMKLECEYFMRDYLDTHGSFPSDQNLQFEGCSIIFGADIMSPPSAPSAPSWLRDLFMSSEVSKTARLRPMQQIAKLRMTQLTINGKRSIFDSCILELHMHQRINMHGALGLVLSDYTLQQEASEVLECVEDCSPNPSKLFKDFLLRLIWGSTEWLDPLRRREQLVITDDLVDMAPSHQDSVPFNRFTGSTVARDTASFRYLTEEFERGPPMTQETRVPSGTVGYMSRQNADMSPGSFKPLPTSEIGYSGHSSRGGTSPPGVRFLLNDHNSYSRLATGLSRFVVSTMSPKNPNSRVPTDEEIQYQARWIWYDDDDPWNQTPADNPEWLLEFKRNVGLLADRARPF